MNNIMLRIRKRFVNKKANTRKLKYESLLEELHKKNSEIIDLLYERNELQAKETIYSNAIDDFKRKLKAYEERINNLEEKNADLLHENEEKRKRRNKRSVKDD